MTGRLRKRLVAREQWRKERMAQLRASRRVGSGGVVAQVLMSPAVKGGGGGVGGGGGRVLGGADGGVGSAGAGGGVASWAAMREALYVYAPLCF